MKCDYQTYHNFENATADTLWRRVQHQISTASQSVRYASCCFKFFTYVSAHLMAGVPLTFETGSVACPMTCIRVVHEATRRGFLALLWQERTRSRSSSRMRDGGGNKCLQLLWRSGMEDHRLWVFQQRGLEERAGVLWHPFQWILSCFATAGYSRNWKWRWRHKIYHLQRKIRNLIVNYSRRICWTLRSNQQMRWYFMVIYFQRHGRRNSRTLWECRLHCSAR